MFPNPNDEFTNGAVNKPPVYVAPFTGVFTFASPKIPVVQSPNMDKYALACPGACIYTPLVSPAAIVKQPIFELSTMIGSQAFRVSYAVPVTKLNVSFGPVNPAWVATLLAHKVHALAVACTGAYGPGAVR